MERQHDAETPQAIRGRGRIPCEHASARRTTGLHQRTALDRRYPTTNVRIANKLRSMVSILPPGCVVLPGLLHGLVQKVAR